VAQPGPRAMQTAAAKGTRMQVLMARMIGTRRVSLNDPVPVSSLALRPAAA
jgi:hypothetical protein